MTYVILTCSEHFTVSALNELRRHHPNIASLNKLSPQHTLIQSPCSFGYFTQPFQQKPPIYLHHLFPVHQSIPLSSTASDFRLLIKHAKQLSDDHFSVQARIIGKYPYSNIAIEQAIRPGQPASNIITPNGRILSILIVDNCCYMGISWAKQNLSPFPTGRPYFNEPLPNRAGLKLLEALDFFNIQLFREQHVLDLGAAPGAWTEVLRRRGMRIIAVAPRAMYDWLKDDPNVQSHYVTAEDYLPQCHTTFDMFVNDMKLDAQDSARLMVDYAQHLRSQGIAIMTLKLRMRNTQRVLDHSYRILRKAYKIIRVRQLVSNRKEITLFLRRKV